MDEKPVDSELMVTTMQAPAHVHAATPLLRLITILGAILGAILLVGGVYLAFSGSFADTKFSLFGNDFESTSVGVSIAFIGTVLVIITFRRVLSSVDRLAALRDDNDLRVFADKGQNKQNDDARSGPDALEKVLERFDAFIDHESDKLGTQVGEGDSVAKRKEILDAAKMAVERAANHTRHYSADLRIGQRDRNKELELSDEWTEVGNCLQNIDTPEASELYETCFIKARYWSDTDGWDDSYAGGKDISLEWVLSTVKDITTPDTHRG